MESCSSTSYIKVFISWSKVTSVIEELLYPEISIFFFHVQAGNVIVHDQFCEGRFIFSRAYSQSLYRRHIISIL